MYLKALEIQGFKSFPDKTVLTFGSDITAIVGPNGSGKSNISDAIRWVMGEQSSRQLRGAKMEDVIFGGTEKRNQMGFAQVTLVMDNTEHIFPRDEAEVAVTRRYYRSGESEYYINKQQVRLNPVNAARSLKRLPVSPSSATARRSPSASWSVRRRIWCASTTRSPNWNCR